MPLLLQGCVSSAGRIDRQAAAAGMSRTVSAGEPYQHVVYRNTEANRESPRRLVVFLDGDGRPWSADGQQPSTDPTTRRPLALELMTQTPAPALYIGRPCYQQVADPYCSPGTWTSARYSSAVVQSIAAVVRGQAGDARITLVGYSGGGVLAVLAAERLENVEAVITIAANLDTDAWIRHHRYLPLSGSLNPALSERPHPWPEIHLQGARDTVVPPDTTREYFVRFPQARREMHDDYDHVCCWADNWRALFPDGEALRVTR